MSVLKVPYTTLLSGRGKEKKAKRGNTCKGEKSTLLTL